MLGFTERPTMQWVIRRLIQVLHVASLRLIPGTSVAVFVLPAGKNAAAKAGRSGIAKGAEILVSYGKGFWSKRKEEQEETASQDT
jgi:hypothetical protein